MLVEKNKAGHTLPEEMPKYITSRSNMKCLDWSIIVYYHMARIRHV